MFDETPSADPGQPMSGPPPGQPIQPFGVPSYGAPPTTPSSVSPEGMRPIPPPTIPPAVSPKRSPSGGGSRRRLLLIVILVVILLAGGAAVAALVFPKLSPSTNNTNTVVANANTNANVNRAANTNRANANTNVANANTNVNSNANVNVSGNTNTVLPNLNANTNASLNTNANANATNQAANSNTNAAANTNTAANSNAATNAPVNTNTPPSTYTQDTDGDRLNDYLEEWLGTSKTNPDSDSDGFPDGNEVANTYSPLGNGQMTAAGFQTFCAQSTVVRQYGLPSTDISTFCGIGGDMLSNIQVMASNAEFYENLDTQLTQSCGGFAKLDNTVCIGLTAFLLIDYLVSS